MRIFLNWQGYSSFTALWFSMSWILIWFGMLDVCNTLKARHERIELHLCIYWRDNEGTIWLKATKYWRIWSWETYSNIVQLKCKIAIVYYSMAVRCISNGCQDCIVIYSNRPPLVNNTWFHLFSITESDKEDSISQFPNVKVQHNVIFDRSLFPYHQVVFGINIKTPSNYVEYCDGYL